MSFMERAHGGNKAEGLAFTAEIAAGGMHFVNAAINSHGSDSLFGTVSVRERNEFRLDPAAGRNSMHGKARLAAKEQAPTDGGCHSKGDGIRLVNHALVPVTDEHFLDPQPPQQLQLARAVRLIDHPVGLRIVGKIAIAHDRNMLDGEYRATAAGCRARP